MEALKLFGAAIILLGFIYFILTRAINTKNYKRKSLYIFIAGMVLTLFFVGGIIYDKVTNRPLYPNGKYDIAYFAFLIVAFVFMTSFTLFYLIKGIKLNQRFKYGFGYKEVKEKKAKPTVKDKKGYVYIIFKLNNNYLLKKEIVNEEAVYSSKIVKFSHNDFFHDDVIRNTIRELDLNVDRYHLVGQAKKNGAKDDIYYCYQVILNEKSKSLSDFEEFDSREILSIRINDLDKKILFTSILEDNFDIEL